jgi:hypothetical protein
MLCCVVARLKGISRRHGVSLWTDLTLEGPASCMIPCIAAALLASGWICVVLLCLFVTPCGTVVKDVLVHMVILCSWCDSHAISYQLV